MNTEYDVIIIGGGATGLGVAVESASRGYKTILFEAYDFGKGTSSKSTKLVHGGIRYLANLDIPLVKEGLKERYYFLKNAPHVAKPQPYLIPFYSWITQYKYILGVKIYDFLAGKYQIGQSKILNKSDTLNKAPHLNPNGLLGSVIYFDGQFDDTRMLISLMRTFESYGGEAYNYHKIIGLIKNQDFAITGIRVHDTIQNIEHIIHGKTIINATGTMMDSILDIDEPAVKHQHITVAQGTHLVFNKELFNSSHALLIPKTNDNRVLFVLPWHNKIVVGTTDIIIDKATIEPHAQNAEITFIINTLNQYTTNKITVKDIKAVFTGQRPLIKTKKNIYTSRSISRKHQIFISHSNLISIVGGKWTIYRLMGEDTINFAIKKGFLWPTTSKTRNLPLFASQLNNPPEYPLSVYGTDYIKIKELQQQLNNDGRLHHNLPYFIAEVFYHIRYEKARTIEDILARRTRALYLNAEASIEVAPMIGQILAQELNIDQVAIEKQIADFIQFATHYLGSQYSIN